MEPSGSRIPKFLTGSRKRPIQDEKNATSAGGKRPRLTQLATTSAKPAKTLARAGPSTTSKVADKKFLSTKRNLFIPPSSVPTVRESKPVLRTANAGSGLMPPRPVKKPKRAAWDLKGRMQDMEEIHNTLQKNIENSNNRIVALEQDKSKLHKDVQSKTFESATASAEVENLKETANSLKKENEMKEEAYQEIVQKNKVMSEQISAYSEEITTLKSELSSSKVLISTMTANENVLRIQFDTMKMQLEEREADVARMANEIEILTRDNSMQQKELQACEMERRKQHNLIMELKGNIRVFCRLRPALPHEVQKSVPMANIGYKDEKTLEITDSTYGKSRNNFEFSFDHVFRNSASQEDVFTEISQLVQSTLDGYNVCIFAYGQTGSGKTYTMEGPEDLDTFLSDSEKLGMIPRSVSHIFLVLKELEKKDWKYTMEASFIEIYNENIKDMLNASGKCEIKKTAQKGNDCYVSNLTSVPITNGSQVYDLLQKAKVKRAVASTKCNEHSSRSHYVFQMKLRGANLLTEEKCEGILNLVDLAGSERVKESGSTGDRFTEAKNINQSLSNLGNVIMALSQKADHVPYRNSKLTHLLMNSLGGNSKTMMFVNISPCEESVNETINSLRFATKVNQCNIGTAQKRTKS